MLNYLLALMVAQTGQGDGLSPWLILLIFFILVVIVSWAMMRNVDEDEGAAEHHDHHEDVDHTDKAEADEVVEPEPEPAPEPEVEPAPEPEPEPEPLEPDDLKKIEGIGPKVASLLNESGILTFAQLAAAEVDKLNELLDANKLQMMDATSWPKQAQLAAEGKWEELQKLQDELSGGR